MSAKNSDTGPLVGVGMPVYNGEQFLAQTLDSLLAQNHANFEIAISDNASTDRTESICRQYAARDARIRYERQPTNVGSSLNAKHVFDMSRGEYFMWACDHDLWEPTFISTCMAVLEQDPGVVLCYPAADWINGDGESVGSVEGFLDTRGLHRAARSQVVLWGTPNALPVFGVMRRDAVSRVRLGLSAIAPDMIFLFELSFHGAFARRPEVLFHFRRFGDEGSWARYIEKHFGRKDTPRAKKRLYREMVRNYLIAVRGNYRVSPTRWMIECLVRIALRLKRRHLGLL